MHNNAVFGRKWHWDTTSYTLYIQPNVSPRESQAGDVAKKESDPVCTEVFVPVFSVRHLASNGQKPESCAIVVQVQANRAHRNAAHDIRVPLQNSSLFAIDSDENIVMSTGSAADCSSRNICSQVGHSYQR